MSYENERSHKIQIYYVIRVSWIIVKLYVQKAYACHNILTHTSDLRRHSAVLILWTSQFGSDRITEFLKAWAEIKILKCRYCNLSLSSKFLISWEQDIIIFIFYLLLAMYCILENKDIGRSMKGVCKMSYLCYQV